MAERLKVPNDCRELADVVAREHGHVHASLALGPEATLRLLERCDALRRPERFVLALQACECDAWGRTGLEDRPYPQAPRLQAALETVLAVDTAAAAAQAQQHGLTGPAIGQAVRKARVRALSQGPGPGRTSA